MSHPWRKVLPIRPAKLSWRTTYVAFEVAIKISRTRKVQFLGGLEGCFARP